MGNAGIVAGIRRVFGWRQTCIGFASENMEKEIEELFTKLAEDDPLTELSVFIAPHLVGEEWKDVRKAILLMLTTWDDSIQRMRLHMLLHGVGGTGKTEALLFMQEKFNAVMTNAELTSKVGLVGDARGSKISAGLLADYTGNVVCIDELDKANIRDQSGLLQAMEEGKYTIVKGKQRKSFDAEVRVIASANEIGKITKPLLDRFDFIYNVKVATREERAKGVKKIINTFLGRGDKGGIKTIKKYLEWIKDFHPTIEDKDLDVIVNMIKKYILFTHVNIDEVSYRNLELSILRIAYAMAKLKKENITADVIEKAILFKDKMLRGVVGERE